MASDGGIFTFGDAPFDGSSVEQVRRRLRQRAGMLDTVPDRAGHLEPARSPKGCTGTLATLHALRRIAGTRPGGQAHIRSACGVIASGFRSGHLYWRVWLPLLRQRSSA